MTLRHRYLTPSHQFDRAAIMRAAWAKARGDVALSGKRIGKFTCRTVTLREAFAEALRRIWGMAREERSYVLFLIAQAMAPPASPVEAARLAVTVAECADSFTAASNAALASVRAHLATLQHAA